MAFVPALGAAILGAGATTAAATVVGGIVTAGAVAGTVATVKSAAEPIMGCEFLPIVILLVSAVPA